MARGPRRRIRSAADEIMENALERAALRNPLAVERSAPGAEPETFLAAPGTDLAVRRSAPAAPALLRLGAGSNRDLAADVFSVKSGRDKGPSFTDWRESNPSSGFLFDFSNLDKTPDVPQVPISRYVPPRGASARLVDALNNPDVVGGLTQAVMRGEGLGGRRWYNTEPLRERFRSVFGDRTPERYQRFFDAQAATSPQLRVPDNIRTGSYFDYLREQGLPLPEKPARGYGSKGQDLHLENMGRLINEGGWDVLRNPKPPSFSVNLQGNQLPIAVDTHNTRPLGLLSRDPRWLMASLKEEAGAAPVRPLSMLQSGELSLEDALKRPTYWTSKPRDNEYGYYEAWQQNQAREFGMSPAQYQASMWLGAGDMTGLGSAPEPWLQTLEARVLYTADRLGVDPEVVLDKVVKGEMPLFNKGGAVKNKQFAVKR